MKIQIKGPIISDSDQYIYDWFGIPATSPAKVVNVIDKAIKNNVSELIVIINSGGGSVFSASEIYTELKKFEGEVRVEIVGLAASAAGVIAMSGTIVVMSPAGQLMLHNASTITAGDYREMDHTSDFLQKVNQSIMNTYALKTGMSTDELKEMMDAETWMTAQEAKASGFIDEVMFETEAGAIASADRPELVNGVLPQEVINKMRERLASEIPEVVNSATQTAASPKKEGGKKRMNLEELKTENQELYNEVFNLGKEAGVSAERSRIQDIENIAMPGNEEIVNKAKFETGVTASDMAVEILKAQRVKNEGIQKDIKNDATALADVTPTNESTPSVGQSVEDFADSILNKVGLSKGGK